MTKLWKKADTEMNAVAEKYTAGTDYIFDVELLPFDIMASKGHAKGLAKIGILASDELSQIVSALDTLAEEQKKGKVVITPEIEDCHTLIENYLVEKIGEAGKKIHTGRSRNDQVAVATRLYMKAQLSAMREKCLSLASDFVNIAERYNDIPMPGYSHAQQAMLSSVGHYMLAFAESLLDDADYISATQKHLDKNPLGSAAGFGVSIPLDREYTTKELGFAATQVNSLYCQNSRGKFESAYMEALAQVMLTLGKFAGDMVLFTSQEFDFFAIDETLTTGSSIMPQKRNLDACEIMRGTVSVVIANQLMIKDIAKNLLSGYNRDGQLIKKPLIESTHIVADSLDVAQLVLNGTMPKEESIKAKITPGIFAADIANNLVKEKGIAFRDAYMQAMDLVAGNKVDFAENIASKVSLGAPGNLDIEGYRKRIAGVQ
ncbi:MAG TPA: argininosuccinate lyase [Candidatus Paceibacterota bacterium]